MFRALTEYVGEWVGLEKNEQTTVNEGKWEKLALDHAPVNSLAPGPNQRPTLYSTATLSSSFPSLSGSSGFRSLADGRQYHTFLQSM